MGARTISQRKALKATIYSTGEAVRFHQGRGEEGATAAAAAARIRDRAIERLAELEGATN